MSDELTPKARAFLDAHRTDGQPSPADAARVREALQTRLAIPKPPVKTLTGLKAGLLLAAGLAGALALWASRDRSRLPDPMPPPAVAAAEVPVPPVALTPPTVESPPAELPPPPAPPKTTVRTKRKAPAPAPPAAEEPPAVEPAAPPAPEAREPPAAPPVQAPAVDELGLVSDAEDLLRRGQPQAALDVLETWETLFSETGEFEQEARAARVVALCASGALEAGREAARAYLAKFPQSLSRNRVDRACAVR